MRYAETGVTLEVDLTKGSIEKNETERELSELFLGGAGANARLMWENSSLDGEPLSPDNVLIFGSGLLVGTPVVGANRTLITGYSPVNNFLAISGMGGFFGAELKHAGYDHIRVKGRSSEPIYLWIDDDRVEVRDARHLWGKGYLETWKSIREELKDHKIQIAAIGPAGENKVFFANIQHAWNSASRGGLGAVMGSKNLKAIAVRGTKDVYIAQPVKLFELCEKMRREIAQNPCLGDWMSYTDDDRFHHDHFSWGHAQARRKGFWTKEVEERFTEIRLKHMVRRGSCYNCPKDCHHVISYPGRPIIGYKCMDRDSFHMAAFQELDFSYEILPLAIDYGVDFYSCPQVIAFAIELFEDGILTDEDMPGFPSDPRERFYYLLEKIVKREGIGEVLGDGVYWAARKIGRGAEKYDRNTIKKVEQLPIKLYKLNPIYFIWWSVMDRWSITLMQGTWPQDPVDDREKREEFARKWEAAPNDMFKQWFVQYWDKRGEVPLEAACAIADWSEKIHYLDDSLGLCSFLSAFRGQFAEKPGADLLKAGPAYHIHNMPKIVSLATGRDCDEQVLWETAGRIRTLVRAINVIRGHRRRDDRPPEDHWKVRDPDLEKQALEGYYELQGWDQEGIPKEETLLKYGLEFVSDEFKRRGII